MRLGLYPLFISMVEHLNCIVSVSLLELLLYMFCGRGQTREHILSADSGRGRELVPAADNGRGRGHRV
jgi:hypothetical protein